MLSARRGTTKRKQPSPYRISRLSQVFGMMSLAIALILFSFALNFPLSDPYGDGGTGLFSSSDAEISDLLLPMALDAEEVWSDLLRESSEALRRFHGSSDESHLLLSSSPLVAVEVGLHRARHCLQAARAGLEVHCVEASPRNVERIQATVRREGELHPSEPVEQAAVQRVHLHAAAAGQETRKNVTFHLDREVVVTGDQASTTDPSKLVQVPSLRLDDLVQRNISEQQKSLVIMKLYTQGYEPVVLRGLSNSLRSGRIQFLLMEYWPQGIARMMASMGKSSKDPCAPAIRLLHVLRSFGYRLYALGTQAHPSAAPINWKRRYRVRRPLDTVVNHCHWFLDVEKAFPNSNYTLGYWTEILAVAPGVLEGNGIGHAVPRLALDLTLTGRALRGLNFDKQAQERRSGAQQARQARRDAKSQVKAKLGAKPAAVASGKMSEAAAGMRMDMMMKGFPVMTTKPIPVMQMTELMTMIKNVPLLMTKDSPAIIKNDFMMKNDPPQTTMNNLRNAMAMEDLMMLKKGAPVMMTDVVPAMMDKDPPGMMTSYGRGMMMMTDIAEMMIDGSKDNMMGSVQMMTMNDKVPPNAMGARMAATNMQEGNMVRRMALMMPGQVTKRV